MALTSAQRAILEARLAEAEAAYHSLQTGNSARVVVDQNGERVEYTNANRSALKGYIQELKDQLACVPTRSGPIKVWNK
jgi:hypothetical protein